MFVMYIMELVISENNNEPLELRGENIVEETRAVNFGKILEKAEQEVAAATEAKEAADDALAAVDNAANQTDVATATAKEKAAEARLTPIKKKYGSHLAYWTRMDLFPSMTRENIYPRTAMERTQRRDFLGKGLGKVFPFGLKNKHQMSGAGGASSDLIKLRRLYGRSKYWKKRDWSFSQ